MNALLEFPADEVAAMLEEQAKEAEKVLPRVMSFVVTPDQEEIIEQAVEMASRPDGAEEHRLASRTLFVVGHRDGILVDVQTNKKSGNLSTLARKFDDVFWSGHATTASPRR